MLDRLARRSRRDEETGCLLWEGALDKKGYGKIGMPGRGWRYVHRVAYEILVGTIPDGLHIDHVRARGCRYRNCWEPSHLEPVLPAENVARGDGPRLTRERHAALTHCKRGHELTEENLYLFTTRNGYQCRGCRTCRRAASARHYTERKK